MFILIVAVYTSLGGQFDKPPHDFAKFTSSEACETARRAIEANSHFGVDYVAICEPRP